MKKRYIYLLFLLVVLFSAFNNIQAQIPSGKITFQAVVRDSNKRLIVNQNVDVRISILEGSRTGPIVFQETHNVLSNSQGLITLYMGSGNLLQGNFRNVNWSDSWVKTEIDLYGNQNYSIADISPVNAVPYTLYSESVNDTAIHNYLVQNNYITDATATLFIQDSLNQYTISVLRPEIQDSLKSVSLYVSQDNLYFLHGGDTTIAVMAFNKDSIGNAILDSLGNLQLLQVQDSLYLLDRGQTITAIQFREQQYLDILGDSIMLKGGDVVTKVKIPFYRDSVLVVLQDNQYLVKDSILALIGDTAAALRGELADTATALRTRLRADISDSLSQLNTDLKTAIHDTAMTIRGELADSILYYM